MSRFRKLSHTLWHHQYHIVWVSKYRFRILTGQVASEVGRCIRAFTEQQKCEVVKLNVQLDHVHLIVMVPPKIAVSSYAGTMKGRTAIRVFNKFKALKQRPYWGNHFWARGFCSVQKKYVCMSCIRRKKNESLSGRINSTFSTT